MKMKKKSSCWYRLNDFYAALKKSCKFCADSWQCSTSHLKQSIQSCAHFRSVVNTFAVSKSSPYRKDSCVPIYFFFFSQNGVRIYFTAQRIFSMLFFSRYRKGFLHFNRRFSHFCALFFFYTWGNSEWILLISMSHLNCSL